LSAALVGEAGFAIDCTKTVALNSLKIFEVNKRAIECVSNALARLGEEREVDIQFSSMQ
jgi:hypothetical protein